MIAMYIKDFNADKFQPGGFIATNGAEWLCTRSNRRNIKLC